MATTRGLRVQREKMLRSPAGPDQGELAETSVYAERLLLEGSYAGLS